MCTQRAAQLRLTSGCKRTIIKRIADLAALFVTVVLLQGCVTPSDTRLAVADPSDAAARVPGTNYRAVTRGYQSRRPVEPAPWRERNDSVAPAPNPGGER